MNEPSESVVNEEIFEEVPTYLQSPDFFIYQLDNEEIIKRLAHRLRGEIWDTELNKWVEKGQRLMNDDGIRMLVTIVDSHLSKEKILTDITQEQVDRIASAMRFCLIHHLRMRWKSYNIDKSNLSIILNIVDHHIFCNISRSIGGRTLEYFKPTIKRVETIKPEKEGRGFNIPFFGAKR